MHHHKTYMYINFQQNRVSRSDKTVKTNLFAINRKLHKFATYNSNFKNSLLSDMNHQFPIFEQILRSIGSADLLEPRFKVISTDDNGRTDGQTDERADIASNNIRYFFCNEKILKMERYVFKAPSSYSNASSKYATIPQCYFDASKVTFMTPSAIIIKIL